MAGQTLIGLKPKEQRKLICNKGDLKPNHHFNLNRQYPFFLKRNSQADKTKILLGSHQRHVKARDIFRSSCRHGQQEDKFSKFGMGLLLFHSLADWDI